jgi:hypothetical protein
MLKTAALMSIAACFAFASAASAQTDAAPASAPEAPAQAAPSPVAAIPAECGAFPERPAVVETLTIKNAQPTIDTVNAYLAAVEAVSTCRVTNSNAINARSNELAAYANYSIKAARSTTAGEAIADPAPPAPTSTCADYPALSTVPPATDIPARNAWVATVNETHACRLAEVRAMREQAAALFGGDRAAVVADASALRESLSVQVAALNAAEAAKAKKDKKKK